MVEGLDRQSMHVQVGEIKLGFYATLSARLALADLASIVIKIAHLVSPTRGSFADLQNMAEALATLGNSVTLSTIQECLKDARLITGMETVRSTEILFTPNARQDSMLSDAASADPTLLNVRNMASTTRPKLIFPVLKKSLLEILFPWDAALPNNYSQVSATHSASLAIMETDLFAGLTSLKIGLTVD